MKLCGDQVSAGVDAAEWNAVFSGGADAVPVLRIGVVAVDEVEKTVIWDAGLNGVAVGCVVFERTAVPAHVRYLQSGWE